MGHEFIGFLAGGIKTERMVDTVVDRVWHSCIGAIDARTAGIYQMLNTAMSTPFEDVGKSDDVTVDIG